jgi:hypothetical protein
MGKGMPQDVPQTNSGSEKTSFPCTVTEGASRVSQSAATMFRHHPRGDPHPRKGAFPASPRWAKWTGPGPESGGRGEIATRETPPRCAGSTLQSVRTDLFKNELALLESLWHLGTLFPQRAPRIPSSHPHNQANTCGLYRFLNLYLLLCIEFRMRCF